MAIIIWFIVLSDDNPRVERTIGILFFPAGTITANSEIML